MDHQYFQVDTVAFMARLKRLGNDKNRYWVFPSQNDQHEHDVMGSSVLDIFPQIDFNHQMSPDEHQKIGTVMELLNSNIIDNFAG